MPHQCTDCGRRFDDGSKEMLSGCPNCGGNKFQFMPDSATNPGTRQEPATTEPSVTDQGTSSTARTDSSVARTVGNAATAVRDLVGRSSNPDGPTGSEDSSLPDPATVDSAEESVTADAATAATKKADAATGAADATTQRTDATTQRTDATTQRSGATTQSSDTTTKRTDTTTQSSDTSTRKHDTTTGNAESAVSRMADSEDAAQASARSELVSPEELPSASQTGWEQTTPGPQTRTTEDDETTAEEPPTERPDLSELRAELNQQFESIKVVEPGQYELNLMELFDRQEYIIALQEDGKYTVQVPEHWQE